MTKKPTDDTMTYEEETTYETGGDNILDIDTSDAVKPHPVDDGEYELEVVGYMKDNEDKIVRTGAGGGRYFIMLLEIPSEPHSKMFTHLVNVPDKKTQTPKQYEGSRWKIEELKQAFGVEEINFDKLIGKKGWGILYTKVDQYGEQNKVKEFISSPTDTGDSF